MEFKLFFSFFFFRYKQGLELYLLKKEKRKKENKKKEYGAFINYLNFVLVILNKVIMEEQC